MAIPKEKGVCLIVEETQEHVLTAKLNDSRRKLGNLVVVDLFVSPLLFVIILASLWIELDYPHLNISGVVCLLKHLNPTSTIASFILWSVSHACNMFLLLAIGTDNVRYCRKYGKTIGPVLQIMIIFFFSLLMWSSLNSLPNYTGAKFLIVVCSVTALLANFYNYFMNLMAEHFQLLTRSKMMKFKMAQAV